MRPGQNKRMRGRNNNNNNNRKGPNPLTRSYESNGPDVKIRGTAHHVAEKYLQLARDAQSSGDPVMAESYLQHAEHYFRLIAAAQQAQQQAQVGYVRPAGEPEPEEEEEEDAIPDRFASPLERFAPPAPPPPAFNNQPFYNNGPAPAPAPQPFPQQGGYNGDARPPRPYNDRNQQDRNGQNGERYGNGNRFNQNRPRDNRPPRDFRNDNRNDGYRNDNGGPRPDYRNNDQPRFDNRPAPPVQPAAPEIEEAGLPAFITAPVRVPPPDLIEAAPPPVAAETQPEPEGEVGFHLRPRRRRRPRVGATEEGGEAPTAAPADDVPAGD